MPWWVDRNADVICAECGHFDDEYGDACKRILSVAGQFFGCDCLRFESLTAALA